MDGKATILGTESEVFHLQKESVFEVLLFCSHLFIGDIEQKEQNDTKK